jgi:hypothetical protein
MALAAGTKLGPYEIIARIGAGVMGEATVAFDVSPENCPTSQLNPAPHRTGLLRHFNRNLQ